MKRGLKEYHTMLGKEISGVTILAPMKRGLKDEVWHFVVVAY